MDRTEMLTELLDMAVDNVSEDVANGVYSQLVNREKKTASLVLLIEAEFQDLVESTGLVNMKNDEQWMQIKVFFEDNIDDALLKE